MRLLVLVFAASFLVLLLAFWGVLRVVRRHASKQPHGGGPPRLVETRSEQEPEPHREFDTHDE